MSIIKSFSVGDGDMFYIDHNSDNFSIIDCCMDDGNKEAITQEIKDKISKKGIIRFISTHPDEDHLQGLKYLDEQIGIVNFYCVENSAVKTDETEDFKHYCTLRDGEHAYYISKGCSRKWMNIGDETRGCAGINFKWPITTDENFKEFLYYLLEQVDFNKYSNGSTIPHLYYKDYSCEKVRIPDIKEQAAIAEVLSTADREIELLQQDIEQEKQKKKALMQLLLMGIVRVKI